MVLPTDTATLGGLRQEDLEFEVSLGHITAYILHSP